MHSRERLYPGIHSGEGVGEGERRAPQYLTFAEFHSSIFKGPTPKVQMDYIQFQRVTRLFVRKFGTSDNRCCKVYFMSRNKPLLTEWVREGAGEECLLECHDLASSLTAFASPTYLAFGSGVAR